MFYVVLLDGDIQGVYSDLDECIKNTMVNLAQFGLQDFVVQAYKGDIMTYQSLFRLDRLEETKNNFKREMARLGF